MSESDILKHAAEHSVEHHGGSASEVHSEGIAPHGSESTHEAHEHNHQQQSDTNERNGGNSNED